MTSATVDSHPAVPAAWNSTTQPVTAGTLIDRLDDQARRTPDATALVFEGTTVSYAHLHERADRLARRLAALGAGPESIIAIAVPRSVELVVGLLGILKAGAAYLPVDPDYPTERIAFMLADAGPAAVLTVAATAPRLPSGVSRMLLDEPLAGTEADVVRPGPDHPAYVIYTSGSTGKPKGAVLSHRSVVNRLLWHRDTYRITGVDRILQKTPSGFDVSVWEFFLPLISGAALVLARPEGHRDPRYLADLIRREHITVAHFVPSMLRVFLADPTAAAGTASLRHVFCSGEALPPDLRDRFLNTIGASLHNLYGPTEAAVDVSHWTCVPEPGATTVPIGRPVWNTGLHVLGPGLRPVGVGETGELYLSGVQLARGYLRRPGLTAQRFVADPNGTPGTRLYRTGDLARWRADGVVEFLGRCDDQVKIKGHRIELGEVAAALLAQPGVTAAAAAVRHDRLIGYVTGTAEPDALRERLAETLPEQLVPSAVVTLDAMPLTANGKLDRAALPDATFATAGGRDAHTDIERLLSDLVGELLGVERVGPDDNFIRLGGDSISAISLIARARAAGITVTAQDVLRQPTVGDLAAVARAGAETTVTAAGEGTGDLLETPIMAWLADRGGPIDGFHQSLVLRSPAELTPAALDAIVRSLIDTHDALRIRRTGAGYHLDTTAGSTGTAIVSRVVAAGLTDDELHELISREMTRARDELDLDLGNAVRVVWFDACGAEGRIALVINHQAVDGVSWRILRDDIVAAWHALRAGGAPEPAPIGTSLRGWARLLHEQATTDRWAGQLPYWRDVVPGPPVLASRALTAADVEDHGCRIDLELPTTLTEALLTTVPAGANAEINDVLLAALALALAELLPARSLVIDLEGHGREDIVAGLDTTRTVGWFTSLFPFRLDLTGLDSPQDALRRVKDATRALPDKGLGYGLLRHLNPHTAARLAALPRPELGFNYLGRFPLTGTGDWAIDSTHGVGLDGYRPGMPAAHTVECNAAVQDRPGGPVLVATWTWVPAVISADRVRSLADGWFRMLAAIADHVERHGDGGLTLADLTLTTLTQTEFDEITAGLDAL